MRQKCEYLLRQNGMVVQDWRKVDGKWKVFQNVSEEFLIIFFFIFNWLISLGKWLGRIQLLSKLTMFVGNKIMLPLIDAYTKTSLAMRIFNAIRNLLTKYLFWLVMCEVVITQKQSAIFLKKIAITNPRKQSIRQGV